MNRAIQDFFRNAKGSLRNARPAFPVVLLLVIVQQLLSVSGSALTWVSMAPGEEARFSDLVVVGKLVRIDHDLVKFNGEVYTKHIGFIRVEKVLLKNEDETVPENIRVHWGTNLRLFGQEATILSSSRFLRGAWLLLRNDKDELYIVGPEYGLFVPESGLADFLSSVSVMPSLMVSVWEKDESKILKVRHINFNDVPRQEAIWKLEDDQLLVPVPYEFLLCGDYIPEEDRRPVKVTSRHLSPEETDILTVDPHSYKEREIDITGWIKRAEAYDKDPVFRLKANNNESRFSHYVPFIHQPLDEAKNQKSSVSDALFLDGDWGTSLWWFPSTKKMRRLLIVCGPVLLIGLYQFRHKGRYTLGHLCLGTLLGLVWTLLILTYGLKFLIGLSLVARDSLSLKYLIPMLGSFVFLLALSVAVVKKMQWYEDSKWKSIWLAPLLWIAIPATVVVVIVVAERTLAFS